MSEFTFKHKKPELPQWAVIPYVIAGLAIACLKPILFAVGCVGYLLIETYVWSE